MALPLISVILPVYNGEKFLLKAINSILKQSFGGFELIIINDASSDRSEAIIQSFHDKRIQYIKNEENLGLIGTLNRGFELSKGDFIARMDQDDIAFPTRFEEQLAFLVNLKRPAIVGSNILIINNHNHIIKVPRKMEISAEENFWGKFRKCPLHHPTVMISREIVREFNPFYDLDAKHGEDYCAWIKINEKFPIYNLEKALLFYRMHESNYSKIYNSAQLLTTLSFLKKEYVKLPAHNISDATLKSLLFLRFDKEQDKSKFFKDILEIRDAFTLKFNTKKIVENDLAYSIVSMALKENLLVGTRSLKFIVTRLGVVSLILALKRLSKEAFGGYFLIRIYRIKFSNFLREI